MMPNYNDMAARVRLLKDMFRFCYYHHKVSKPEALRCTLLAAETIACRLDDAPGFEAWCNEQPERDSDAAALEGWARAFHGVES